MSRGKTETVPGNVLELALEIDRIRTSDPAHYRRVMRKLEQFKAKARVA